MLVIFVLSVCGSGCLFVVCFCRGLPVSITSDLNAHHRVLQAVLYNHLNLKLCDMNPGDLITF